MKRLFVIMICGAMLATAAPVMASPTSGAYSGQGTQQLKQVQGKSASRSPSSSSPSSTVQASTASQLPFTGLNLGTVAVVAVMLAGAGLVLRRGIGSDKS